MSKFEMHLTTADSEKDLMDWVRTRGDSATVHRFKLQADNLSSPNRIWVITFSEGSGLNYVSAYIFRESATNILPHKIYCVSASIVILFGQIQVAFDSKRRSIKIFGSPNRDDLGFPNETNLVEYCIGKILF